MTDQPNTVRIGPIEVQDLTAASVVDHVRTALRAGAGGRIATPNVDHLYQARRDPEALRLLESADLRVADGLPLVWASRISGNPLPERVAGSDLVWRLAELAEAEGVPLVLLGGTDESVQVAAEKLRRHAPGVEVIAHSPPMGFENDRHELCRMESLLDPRGAGIVLCGVGFPKQERLAEYLARTHPHHWFLGCGAAIDMVAGRALRAPDALQRLGLEWTYRLIQEPRRLFRRYVLHDLPFALALLARTAVGRLRPRSAAAGGPAPARPPVFIAWGLVSRRAHELAEELGADVLACYPPGTPGRPPVLRRYLLSTLMTVRYLMARRPSAVIVTNPPIIPSLLAYVYSVVTGRPLVLDDHPGAFGAMGYTMGKRLEPLHRMVARRARGCLVTDAQWVDVVRSWGGRGVILHESPGTIEPAPARPCRATPEVLFVSVFARDEPVEEVLAAARLAPELHFRITGDRAKAPEVPLPANVELVGLLDYDDYVAALRDADVVLALTTEPTSAMRAGFEAVWAEKVLVVSDWPLSKELFPSAVSVANTAEAVASGLREAVADHASLAARAGAARHEQLAQWEEQLTALRELVGRA